MDQYKRVIVTGGGRGGTNWITEILRISNYYKFTTNVEDRQILGHDNLYAGYATKLATENKMMTFENINMLLKRYDDLKLVFSVRHPIDHCISKIYRGRPSSQGGDGSDQYAPDSTIAGSIAAVNYVYTLYKQLKNVYPNRIIFVKLENLININNRRIQINKLCEFLHIEFNNNMLLAHKNNRNKYQKKRYGDTIDITQLNLRDQIDTIYNGFFKDKKDMISIISNSVTLPMKGFEYI